MDMWLLGRRSKLNVHGLPHTIDRIEKLMELYDWGNWPDFFPVSFHRLPDLDKTLVLENPEFRVYASPVCHLIPAIGLRIEFLESGKTLAYSCDTEPCQAVIDLAAGANILIHEATGAGPGHSSAAQAAQVARQAKVGSLYLIHYTNGPEHEPGALIHEAQAYFPGEVRLAEDFLEIEL
jgi:ribonuclease Z